MDFDSSNHDDPSNPTDPDSQDNDDFGLNMVQVPALQYDHGIPSDFGSTASDLAIHCINCGMDVSRRRRRLIINSTLVSVVRQWISPRVVSNESVLCQSCWMVALHELPTTSDGRQRQLCINCRCSLHRTRFHILNEDTPRGREINNIVANWIQPLQIGQAYDLKSVTPDIIKKRSQRTGDGSHYLWGWDDPEFTEKLKDQLGAINHAETRKSA